MIFPNQTQSIIIEQTLGACRWIHNRFIGYNIEKYKDGKPYTSAYDFSLMLTKLKKENPEYSWLNDVSQKAIKEQLIYTDKSFKSFFKKKKGFPKFKSKKKNPVTSYYLYPVVGKHKHNKIKLPLLGWMRISENSYVIHSNIINARLIKENTGKYFIQLSTEIEPETREVLSRPIGIDVGIKKYISISDDIDNFYQVDSFLNDDYIIKKENKIKNLQRIISNKAEINYGRLLNKYYDDHHGEEPIDYYKNIMKGESYGTSSIYKIRKKISLLNDKIYHYKKNKIDQLVSSLVKTKPEYIAIEDLSISNMISRSNESHVISLSKHIQDSKFYYFKEHLIHKCKYYNIEIHLANKYFASSKTCSCCGNKNKNLTLNDRTYKCPECGFTIDRDINAAINLVHMKKKEYKVI